MFFGKSFFLPISLLYICIFAVSGPMVMFYPVFLQYRGVGPEEIGYAMSAMSFAKLLSVFIMAFIIDKSRKPQLYLVATSIIATCVILLIYGFSMTGNILILMSFLFSFGWSLNIPLGEGFAMRACRLQKDLDYSRMRLLGSASFMLVGNITGYLTGLYGFEIFGFIIITASLLTLILGANLPNFYALEKQHLIITDTVIDAQSLTKMLLTNVPLMVIIAGASIMHAGHAVLFQHAPNHWIEDGYSPFMVSLFLGFGIVAEVAIFWYGKKLKLYLETWHFLLIAGIGSSIRWFAMAFDLSTAEIFFFQGFHAFTFAILHLGVIRYIKQNLKGHYHGAAQLVYSGCMWGLFMMPTAAVSGHLYEMFDSGAYFFMSGLAVTGTVIALSPFVTLFQKQKLVSS